MDSELIDRYVAQKVQRRERTPQTGASLRRELLALTTFVVAHSDRALTETSISAWLANEGWSKSTVANRLSTARGFTAWLSRRGVLAQDPCALMVGPRRPRALPVVATRGEVASLFRACTYPDEPLMLSLMVQEGLRCGEVAGLSWEHVDTEQLVLRVMRGKNSDQRHLPISLSTMEYLAAITRRTKRPVFRSRRGGDRAATANTISVRVRHIAKRARVKVTAHTLRRTAATDMMRNGAHIRDVQTILGHTRVSTTSRYLFASVEDLRQAIDGRRYDTAESLAPTRRL